MSDSESTPDGGAVWDRRAARLIVVDDACEHVLLVLGFDPRRPDEPYWFTVGGGIDPGESPLEAVVREAAEEIGYAVDPARVAGPFRPEQVEFSFDGTLIRQHQAFYVVQTPRFAAGFVGVDDVERDSTVTVAWVPLHGIRELAEPVFPPHLTEIVAEWRAAWGEDAGRRLVQGWAP